jgi:tetratricopeptide (TPR) repeat protein
MAKVSLRAYNREIEAMIDRGHLDEAVAHCQHILKTFPKHLETYRLLGKAYLEAKRHNEAVDIFSRVLSAEPNDFVAHVGMSIIRDEQNKVDDAIWHMERAFEVQSANPAIQSELQRLYGRREGVQPPRIRMTRGALAHMYMRGELYPQAISETRGVLEEDQGRSDMQVLLAKAYYKSGQKKDAADAASVVLKRYPFCLDANLVLAEVLGADRPESAQIYRHRVIELDPYAAQVVEDMFRANEVSDAAVSMEHLEWNGQPVGMSTDWASSRAIGLEAGTSDRDEQPEWMRTSFPEESAPSTLDLASAEETFSTPTQSEGDIPDFLREAGWGASTGTFDESKSSAMFDDEPATEAEPTAEGDLPDWVKAMAPQESAQPAEEQREEEIPDWISKIGTDELPVPSAEVSASGEDQDRLSGLGESSETQPSSEGMDWMKEQAEEEQVVPETSAEESDWMKGFDREEQPAPASEDQPDWMKGFEQEESPAPASDDLPDWMKDFGAEEQTVPQQADEQSDWMKGLEQEEQPVPEPSAEQHDWMKGLADEPLLSTPSEPTASDSDLFEELRSETAETLVQPAEPTIDTGSLGTSEEEQDDSFAWLESLAAKQGATEGLLTKPEERREDEPEWIKQAKSLTRPAASAETEVPQPEISKSAPAEDTGSLGTSEEEQDDSFAWLEALAAKQGATEGLLTRPEERREDEPDWVKQAKSAETPKPEMAPQTPAAEEQLPVEEEAILEPEPSAAVEAEEEEVPAPAEEEPVPAEETPSWLKGFDEETQEGVSAPVAEDDTTAWLKSLDEPEEEPITLETSTGDLPDWMQDVSEEVPESEPAVPMEEAETPSSEPEELPSWLRSLEEEEAAPSIPASDDLPAWMRDETGEVVAEPTKIEPTRSSDWAPADEVKEETAETPQPAPQPVSEAEPEAAPEAKPKKAAPKKEPATRRAAGTTMSVDPNLDSARTELSRSNIPGALDAYGKLIKKGRFLEEVIFDLREALYRYPVEVSIWQALGDAYMRSNQLQDALDSYTKAEELLR